MREFDRESTEYWIYLTREEWEAVYCVGLFYRHTGQIPPLNMNDTFRLVIVDLVNNFAASFKSVHVGSDGGLWTDAPEPVETRNAAFLALMLKGAPPDYEVHVGPAQGWLEEFAHDFPLDDFKDFRRALEKAAEDARAAGLPEDAKEAIRDAVAERELAVN